MPSTDQAAQIAQAALQAPINNLVVLLAIIALLIMALGAFLIWKFATPLLKLYQQQAATNEKLTQIVGQNSEQAKVATQSVENNTAEMKKQTEAINTSIAAIDNQTQVIQVQNLNHNNYQTLVSDTMSAVKERVDGLETSVNSNTESIAALTEQIKALVDKLDDKAACADAEERMRQFRDEIVALVTQQQSKKTADLPAVTQAAIPPANVIPYTPAAGSEAA